MAAQQTHRGVGFFTEEKAAEQAIKGLEASGFPMEQVSVLAKQLESDVVASEDLDRAEAVLTDNDIQAWDVYEIPED